MTARARAAEPALVSNLTAPSQVLQYPRLTVHDDFVETFGMELAAGRGYSRDFPADTSESVMINIALVRQLGWGTAEETIGRPISVPGPGGPRPRTVIGVSKDFHYASLHQDIGPFVAERYNSQQATRFFGRYMAIRIGPGDVEGTLAFLEGLWERYESNRAFEYFFLDDELDTLYKAEATLGRVATTFSILAILVACLGVLCHNLWQEGSAEGRDVTKHLDLSKARRPPKDQKRFNVDFPTWMVESLDREAARVGVTRQSIIKVWLAERLEQSTSE